MNIKLFTVWLGDFPKWFPYYLISCESNPNIEWYIFSDHKHNAKLPTNVKIIPFSLDDFNNIASAKLGFKINVTYPYKLCDFKPLYGYLFDEYLKETDYWGYTDIDLIYGNTDKFLKPLLGEYDVISSRKEILAGHFTILKNNTKLKKAFLHVKNYKNLLLDGKCVQFDENAFHEYIKTLNANGSINVHYKTISEDDQMMFWKGRSDFFILYNNGKLKDVILNRELMYFHFLESKRNIEFKIQNTTTTPFFYITKRGFNKQNKNRLYIKIIVKSLPFLIKQFARKTKLNQIYHKIKNYRTLIKQSKRNK